MLKIAELVNISLYADVIGPKIRVTGGREGEAVSRAIAVAKLALYLIKIMYCIAYTILNNINTIT